MHKVETSFIVFHMQGFLKTKSGKPFLVSYIYRYSVVYASSVAAYVVSLNTLVRCSKLALYSKFISIVKAEGMSLSVTYVNHAGVNTQQ